MKRIFDFCVALILLLILSPILLPVAIALRFSGENKVFYRQKRIGLNNEVFTITKFATMLEDSPNMEGGSYTLKDDPRILPMGGFLRKSKINEIPQLLDVLFGKMSFVGPRPQMIKVHSWYPEEYSKVFVGLRPGITGIGSIVFRNEESILLAAKDYDYCYKNEIIPAKTKLELWYKNNRTFFGDVALMFITAWVVIFPESSLMSSMFPNIPEINCEIFGKQSNVVR
ncbi:MAG: lipid carrier--UDP-N-acetylgalactosaminyltransferase [Alphaproteobacteria bacterium]|nr:MAG: lipid carrier--UDP-N-acetylgalactosaminyltransferase [Alphaproteobacteria bacterium]